MSDKTSNAFVYQGMFAHR